MNRKQFKNIQNTAAKQIGRAAAKEQFRRHDQWIKGNGAFIHAFTATLFKT